MQRDEAREVITAALRLAKERVTGDLEAKEIMRERLADLIVRMDPRTGCPPEAADLTEVLGEDLEPSVRKAVGAWSQEDAPVTPQ